MIKLMLCKWEYLLSFFANFLFSKDRIEKRGPIAKDVTLDVQIFKPLLAKSLLDEITQNKQRGGKFNFSCSDLLQPSFNPNCIRSSSCQLRYRLVVSAWAT